MVTVVILTIFISRTTQDTIVEETGQRLSAVSDAQGLLIGELVGRQVNALLTLSENKGIQEDVIEYNNIYEGSEVEIQQQLDDLEATWQSAEESDPLPQSRLDSIIAEELREYQELYSSNINLMVTDRYGGVVGITGMVN
ncbi:MAG: hypothetical protein GWO28_13685, partial [candidate division Zixibacteria bacterium]|nr:hypothetical protein [candidate division Zixibacteria bacterium]